MKSILGYWAIIKKKQGTQLGDWTEEQLLEEAQELNPRLAHWFRKTAAKQEKEVGEVIQEMLKAAAVAVAEIKVEDDEELGRQRARNSLKEPVDDKKLEQLAPI